MSLSLYRLAAAVLVCVICSGCYVSRYYTDDIPNPTDAPDYEDKFHSNFLGGLINAPNDQVDIGEICPNGVRYINTKMSFLNGLVTGLTFNIYAPTHSRVWCNE